MKNNLLVLLSLGGGILVGWYLGDEGVELIREISTWMLYLLIFEVGITMGANGQMGAMRRNLHISTLLLPIFTILGTVVFTAAASLLLSRWSMADCMAFGSGFGYYSLSSILISQLKEMSDGMEIASQAAAVALLSNILRELLSLVGAPLYKRYCGSFAPIAAAGSTSMDVCLPIISRHSGNEFVPIAILHGMMLDMSVPILVTFFCGL